jgi:hypothetical protein
MNQNPILLFVHANAIKEFTVKKDVLLKEKDIWESSAMTDIPKGSRKFYVLFGLSEGSRVTANARRAVASEEYSQHVAALAICGEKIYESIRATLFSKVHRPKVPTRSFENRKDALEWLTMIMNRKG